VQPLVVVRLEIFSQRTRRLRVGSPRYRFGVAGLIIVQVHLLILHRAPQPFSEDVVEASAATVHADAQVRMSLEDREVLSTRELAALVGVVDLGDAEGERGLDGLDAEPDRQTPRQPPRQDVPRIPVQDRHEVKPLALGAHVGEIRAPNLIGTANGHVPQEVRIGLVGRVRRTRLPARTQGLDAHHPHQALDPFVVVRDAVAHELCRDPGRAVVRVAGVDLVNPVH